jgi:hypothetical protein
MNSDLDRLYQLLPAVYRQRDAEHGFVLQALLQVVAEQVQIVESDIAQLYDNWFIETCEDWVVPYLGDLIGYRSVHSAGNANQIEPGQRASDRQQILIPRRDLANTLRYRQRKGTLALLELLAQDVAGWPARAVEFLRLLSHTQPIRQVGPTSSYTVDLRRGQELRELGSPFDRLAHTIDLRRPNSQRTVGRYNLPSVGLFVWRLQPYSVTQTPAYCVEEVGSNCYSFSVLGNDTALYNRPIPETDPTGIAEPLNLPIAIHRRRLQHHPSDYYGMRDGVHQSIQIWRGGCRQPIPAEDIVVADLSQWHYRPQSGQVALDPELGRIVFPPNHLPKKGVWVSYYYAFSADLGGGEYDRPLSQPSEYVLYQVSKERDCAEPMIRSGRCLCSINAAIEQWQQDQQAASTDDPEYNALRHAVIEIIDSEVYVEQLCIQLAACQSLQIRAANGKRPVIRLLDWHTDLPDSLQVSGAAGSRFVLDGVMITGRSVAVTGELFEVVIRHSTLVPGWGLRNNCEPQRPAKPSLELRDTTARVTIDHSIIGAIEVSLDEVDRDPIAITIRDSIVDATSSSREALGAPGCLVAHTVLTLLRSTVFGQIATHAIQLAENSLLNGLVRVARRQTGCVRFCYVPPGSRTPRRYHCQPDLVEQAIDDLVQQGELPAAERDNVQAQERDRVQPQYTSARYGTPTYGQLAITCAEEIKQGADDESEMGVFHDLYQPQRAANLTARLEEYTPAGMNVGILYVN